MATQGVALRAKQAPIKEAYRNNPSSAIVTLTSSGSIEASSITCSIDGPNAQAIKTAHKKVAGLHPAAGGPDPEISGELCSGDMLLEALVACSGVTLKAVATALDIPIESGRVWAEGDLDFKGTLGVDRDAPVGFIAIRLGFDLQLKKDARVEEGKIEKLGKLTERYCVVLQTIAKKPELIVKINASAETKDGEMEQSSWVEQS